MDHGQIYVLSIHYVLWSVVIFGILVTVGADVATHPGNNKNLEESNPHHFLQKCIVTPTQEIYGWNEKKGP